MKRGIAVPGRGLYLDGTAGSRAARLKGAISAAAVGVLSSLAVGMWSTVPHSYTISIYGTVPAVCHAEFKSVAIDLSEGMIDLGTMQEFCNSPGGYQVWLETTPGVPSGFVYVDNFRIPLMPNGATLIHQADRAGQDSLRLYLDSGDTRIASVSLRMVPL